MIEFNSVTRPLFAAPMPVDAATLARARAFVAGLRAGGGTEMMPALTAALESPIVDGFVRQVVFLTDGAVGNEQELLRLIDARVAQPAPLHRRHRPGAQHVVPAQGGAVRPRHGDLHRRRARSQGADDRALRQARKPGADRHRRRVVGAADAYPRAVPDLYLGEPSC